MRQRVKAKVPKWLAGVADITLVKAQQTAAPRASRSYGENAKGAETKS
jgi:hypothetical protein